ALAASSSAAMPRWAASSATSRYSAPLSSRCQSRCAARRRARVPLPAPLGPSMVITGTALLASLIDSVLHAQLQPGLAGQRRKARKGGGDIGDVAHFDRPAGAQTGHGKGHGDAVIVMAVHCPAL